MSEQHPTPFTIGDRTRVHGEYRSREHRIWRGLINRCTNPKGQDFHLYGGRGIKVCERWRDFRNFLADMGRAPVGQTLDRHPDQNGNYEPSNCRWATAREQARNRRANTHVTVNGVTRCLAEWAEVSRLHPMTINSRLRTGWPPELAVTVPARSGMTKERAVSVATTALQRCP